MNVKAQQVAKVENNVQPIRYVLGKNKPEDTVKPSQPDPYELEKLAFQMLNDQRLDAGLKPLLWSDDVAIVARIHSDNMARKGFFNHRGLDGKMVNDRADAVGLTKWRAIGENIAYLRGYKDPVGFAVQKWMESPGHRQNLLSDSWIESGIGLAITADGTYYFTQVFLKRN